MTERPGARRRTSVPSILLSLLALALAATACSSGRRHEPRSPGSSDGGSGVSSLCGLCPAGTYCEVGVGCLSSRPCERASDCGDDDPCTVAVRCHSSTRTCVLETLDGDGDGQPPRVCGGTDCDDSNPWVGIDREACDGIDNDCDGRIDEDPIDCGAGRTCRDARCACVDASHRECGSSCVDVTSSNAHCGGCYRSCGGSCVGGRCDCGSMVDCGGICRDLGNDPDNCGTCGFACTESGRCTAGRCDACGAEGQACCVGASCGAGMFCDAGTCARCGGEGEACCPGYECDAGACVSGMCPVRTCDDPVAPWPEVGFPRCSASTYACASACASDLACVRACLEADATAPYLGADCANCFWYQVEYCSDRIGCRTDLNALRCCMDDYCPAGSSDACVDTYCPTQVRAYSDCVLTRTTCTSVTNTHVRRCFP